jgi:5-methylcytosine-specific restriction endonuclease McrA
MSGRKSNPEKLAHLIHDQLGLCYYCKVQMKPQKDGRGTTPTIEHKVPFHANGGGGDNLVACCFACNAEKGPLDHDTYMNLRKFKYALKAAKSSVMESIRKRSSTSLGDGCLNC